MSAMQAVLWPTPEQEMVLQIAVGRESRATETFVRWAATLDLEGPFDYGAFRLLPLVFNRMHALGMKHPLMARLRGIYRKSWYESELLTHRLSPVVAALHARGIRTILLKGAALQRSYYRNDALRPMHDLDVFVHPNDRVAAVAMLDEMGWQRDRSAHEWDFQYRHSMLFHGPDNLQLDLHWHLMREACFPAASEAFWSRARPLAWGGLDVLQLGSTDMLLHTVIHGVRANREPPLRWIADAITILRTASEEINWKLLLDQSKRLRLNTRLSLGLDHLAERYAAPIPPEILDTLRRRGASWVERVENAVHLRDNESLYANKALKPWVAFADYVRVGDTRRPLRFAIGFSRYLPYRLGARGRIDLVVSSLRGLARRILHHMPAR